MNDRTPDAIELRAIRKDDAELLLAIYASTRQEELAQVSWTATQKDNFLRMQFEAQRKYYESEYPGAEFQIIMIGGQPAGRLYVYRRDREIRIMDIALLPEYRGRGIGTKLLIQILEEGSRTARAVTIHVESFNRAQQLYERLGFKRVATNGVYYLLEWAPAVHSVRSVHHVHSPLKTFVWCLLFSLLALMTPAARAQSLGATMVTSLTATQGETITYTVVITNRTTNVVSDVTFNDVLDPNTTFVPGSINTSPLAFEDSFAAVGNVQITVAAPGVLANDVDRDGVGPGLSVTAATTTSANGGNVSITANGAFTYNPPRGFDGIDTFVYQLNDGEGFIDIGTVSMTVTGMIWFVNSAAAPGGDGRLTSPFNTLPALAAINNGTGNNPAAGDNIFLYSGNYTGPLTLLNNQKLIGQGARASLGAITGLTPPAGSLPLPATGGASPLITGTSGITLGSGNVVRGFNLSQSGGTALLGSSVGPLTAIEMFVTNTAGTAVNLANGNLNVTFDSVTAAGGPNGIRLVNCNGRFGVTGNGALAQNGSGGTIQNTTRNAIHLDNVSIVDLTRMNINNSGENGIFGQNLVGFSVEWCSLSNNGDAVNECGIRLGDPVGANGVIGGPTRIGNTTVRASGEMNIAIYNSAGVLPLLDMVNVVCNDTRTRPLGADGFYFETRGTAVATVNVTNCSFVNNFTQGIQASALGQSVLTINVTNCGFTNNNEGIVLANANDADINFDINNNRFLNNLAIGASGSAIAAVNATTVTPSALYSGKIRNNTINGGGIDNHLVAVLLAGAGNNTLHVGTNNISAPNAQFGGIFIQAGETGSGNLTANVTVTGNTMSLGSLGSHGIAVQSRITSALCAEIAGNVSTTGGIGLFGLNVRQRDTSTFRLPGYAGGPTDTTAVNVFLSGKNPGTTVNSTVATGYSGGAPCALPMMMMAMSPAELLNPNLNPNPNPMSSENEDPPVAESNPPATPASIPSVSIGTLPGRKSITITFRAVIANPMPSGTCIISNQGTVTATGEMTVLTDDPRTAPQPDATFTAVLVPPIAITQAASGITGTAATLNGSLHPCGSPARYYFHYGLTTAYGSTTPANNLPAGMTAVPVSATVTGLEAGATYHFRLVATNDFGTNNGADLTFTTPLTIFQPPADAIACVGGTATFSVTASSSSVTYQWQKRPAGTPTFENIPGATAMTYTTPPVTPSDDGTTFRVIVSGASSSVTSTEAFLSVISIASPQVTYDFNSGLPAGTAIYSNAFIDVRAGVLELNKNAQNQTGAFLTTDLAPGRVVRGFAATFKARLLADMSRPADGFSFNWATDLPNGAYAVAEEGEGSGLRVCFDTWDNGAAEAPAIDVWWGPNLVARKSVPIGFLVRGPNFFDVQIRLSPDGLLDLTYACEPVFSRLPVSGYTPQMGARFGLGARTGLAFETHSVDDLALELYLDPRANLPIITSITPLDPTGMLIRGRGIPRQNYSVEVSTDLISWRWRANVLANSSGLWDLLEPDSTTPPYQFYRLLAAPQFPSGLVTWWRADGDFRDSFGPNHGKPEDVMPFAAGQRGQAFTFNGTTDAMLIGARPIPVPWTAAFWVNRQASANASSALLADDATGLKLVQWNSQQVGFTQFGVADYYFSYAAPSNTWLHLTFVGTGSGTALYVNGRPQETHPNVIDLPMNSLGRREGGLDRLKGLVDEVTIFNRDLTPAEIQQLHNTTRGP